MQEIYRRTPKPKCEFNKVAKQLPLNPLEAKFKARFFDFFIGKGVIRVKICRVKMKAFKIMRFTVLFDELLNPGFR